MSAAVTLQITVTDGNDHAPTFLGLPYTVRLEEGTAGPLTVLVAMATDLDEGSNGEVEFILMGGDGAPLIIYTYSYALGINSLILTGVCVCVCVCVPVFRSVWG